jgi:aspartyl/asparaginyl-tRNA synthetase
MLDTKIAKAEFEKLMTLREDFLKYLDENIPKADNKIEYDFTNNPTVDAKIIYEHFYKLDYQARKIKGLYATDLGFN